MKNWLAIIISLCASGASVGYACYVSKKNRDLVKKLDLTIDDLSKSSDIDISEKVLNAAVDKAVKRAVDTEVQKSISWIQHETSERIKNDVQAAINEAYPNIKPELKRHMEDKLENIDISSLRNEIVEEAAKKASRKFDSDLEGVLNKYNDQLSTISSVYKSIQRRINRDDDISLIFR